MTRSSGPLEEKEPQWAAFSLPVGKDVVKQKVRK